MTKRVIGREQSIMGRIFFKWIVNTVEKVRGTPKRIHSASTGILSNKFQVCIAALRDTRYNPDHLVAALKSGDHDFVCEYYVW